MKSLHYFLHIQQNHAQKYVLAIYIIVRERGNAEIKIGIAEYYSSFRTLVAEIFWGRESERQTSAVSVTLVVKTCLRNSSVI